MPDEKDYIEALLREKAGYEARAAGENNEEKKKGWQDHVKACEKELSRFASKAKAPAKRATTRTQEGEER